MMLTPEQNTKWQKAIKPLDYLDLHALSEESLQKSEKRLKANKGAPGWAITVRELCISKGWAVQEAWVPDFALRSEVAIVGLKLLYPDWEDRVKVYQWLLIDFQYRALAPLEEDTIPLREVRRLCSTREIPIEEWFKQQCSLYAGMIGPDHPDKRAYFDHAYRCMRLLRNMQSPPPAHGWYQRGSDLFDTLYTMHDWLLEKGSLSNPMRESIASMGRYQPLADAFLAALESECPAPDWLIRKE